MEPEGCALVTGASRGIGRGVALELARRGFEVVATMRNPAAGSDLLAADDELAGTIRVERLDVTDPASMRIPEGLTVLVNNAALEGENLSVEDTSIEQWRQMFETNVFGLVELTRRAIPELRASGGGVICNLTSSSILVPMPFYAVYRASKAAVQALGESLAAELAPHGIRVLEVLPGPVATDMLAESSTLPEAHRSAPYRELAERVARVRDGVEDAATPVEEAAVVIVDAICDDGSPMRIACDPLGAGLLEGWATTPDPEHQRGFLSTFEPG